MRKHRIIVEKEVWGHTEIMGDGIGLKVVITPRKVGNFGRTITNELEQEFHKFLERIGFRLEREFNHKGRGGETDGKTGKTKEGEKAGSTTGKEGRG